MVMKMNGTLFPNHTPSWSRKLPGPETEEIWKNYEMPRIIPLSEDDVTRLGKDASTAAQFPADWNMPQGSYIGSVDVFHKFHCLNQLRRRAFRDFPTDTPEHYGEFEMLDWIHLAHCVDMIAQDIQCNAKLDVYTFNWMDTQVGAYPDFGIDRICTNWDQFLDWNTMNALNPMNQPPLKMPEEVRYIPNQDAYYEMFGFGGSVLYPGGKGYKPEA